jgi:hypothetical protein
MTSLAVIEGELIMQRLYLLRAARAEEAVEVGSPAYMELAEIIDDLLERIQQLVLCRLAVLRARGMNERHTVQ